MKNKYLLLAGVLLAVWLLVSGCSSAPAPSAANQGAKGQQEDSGTAAALGALASFSADTLDGGTFTQDDIQEKDVTVINFWSLTCGPCIAEMPDLAAFAAALPDNVQVITVCLDGAGNETYAGTVLEEAGFVGVTLISGDGDLQTLCGNLMYTPTTVFVDAEGNLVGDAVIGRQADLAETFLEAVNQVLTAGGKEAVSLES